jgi:hypothetical protein
MFFALCLPVVTTATSLAIIIVGLRNAPEAYENEQGLQIIHLPSRQQAVSRSSAFSAKHASSHSRYWRRIRAFLHIGGATVPPHKRVSAKA